MYQNEEKTMSANARTQDTNTALQDRFHDSLIAKDPAAIALALNLARHNITDTLYDQSELEAIQRQAWMYLGVLYGRRKTCISIYLSGTAMLHISARRYPFITVVHWFINRSPVSNVYGKSFPKSDFVLKFNPDPWWAYIIWIVVFLLEQLPSFTFLAVSLVATRGAIIPLIISAIVSFMIGNILNRIYASKMSAIRYWVSRRLLPPQPR
jgi:hypothetical protein